MTGTLGIPEWWPTGSRIAVVFAQASAAEDPLIESVQRELTERRFLTLRFPMPYMQAGKRKVDDIRAMRRTFQSAVAMLSRDPTAAPAHIFIGGKDQGALVAAHTANDGRMRVEGVFFMGYPLHKQDDTSDLSARGHPLPRDQPECSSCRAIGTGAATCRPCARRSAASARRCSSTSSTKPITR